MTTKPGPGLKEVGVGRIGPGRDLREGGAACAMNEVMKWNGWLCVAVRSVRTFVFGRVPSRASRSTGAKPAKGKRPTAEPSLAEPSLAEP